MISSLADPVRQGFVCTYAVGAVGGNETLATRAVDKGDAGDAPQHSTSRVGTYLGE